jgi:glucosamine--fructose-6-phosphate aminotransferase (isomerizing)
LARHRGADPDLERLVLEGLSNIRCLAQDVLELSDQIKRLAQQLYTFDHVLFLGRGLCYPIAKEGSLKLKEISYIHAEAYAAGELKHGPLALVDASMPVIALAPSNICIDKIKSNLQEVRARNGKLMIFTDHASGIEPNDDQFVVYLPDSSDWATPIVYSIALQLLAYYVAILRGTDVDQPRNLAKSVTVE